MLFQFIGELYKLKMLTARIMHECIKKLLKSKDEESLESLSRLLTTVGKDLEAETNEKMKAAKSQEEVKNIVSLISSVRHSIVKRLWFKFLKFFPLF